MTDLVTVPVTTGTAVAIPRQADTDDQVIALWLHGRGRHTRRAYQREIDRFLAFTGETLHRTTMGDVQAFTDSLDLAPASLARALAAIKSLLTFAHERIGYLPFNVGAPVKVPVKKNTLAERILPEETVLKMLALEPSPRNRALLRLLYAAGLRVSELVALTWADMQEREDGGQVTVFGKGGKTRAVLLSEATWRVLVALRTGDGPVFQSRKGGALDPSMVLRIVRAAAERAGVDGKVSPHWLRHAHASHALDRGAPIHLVQATLGHSSVETTGRYLHARPTDSSSRYLAV